MLAIDLSFGIKSASWETLWALKPLLETDAHFGSLETYPWYNGRECGFSLVHHNKSFDGMQYIVFSECRNSDYIMVYNWNTCSQINPPTIANFSDKIWKAGRSFATPKEAANHIANMIAHDYSK